MKSFAIRLVTAGGLIAIVAANTWAQSASQPAQPRFGGSEMFGRYCATCHGARAIGDGPLAAMLRKPPANLTLLALKNGGVFSGEMVSRIIDGRKPLAGHGGGDMPAWGDAFGRSSDGPDTTPDKIAALVNYLESIQQKP